MKIAIIVTIIFVGLWLAYLATGRGCRPDIWSNGYWYGVGYKCHFWTSP